ncbi:MAG: UTP--glucose-1-phosphate uridylyltransferase [Alphaproteobacteria bacterium ADurb.Bin438]|nr:MAG: UTP--glucose-1-phosphate uridylyltransferase [Alphaproteobacteria bacterium ADurb.Bin438]
MKPVKKVVIPVAGMGTRILPATKAVPKEMLTVVDKPLIDYAVSEAIEAGIEQIIFITGKGKSAIINYFDVNTKLENVLTKSNKMDLLAKVKKSNLKEGQAVYVRQSVPLGLGHAISLAKGIIGDEPFAVILPDDLIMGKNPLKELIEVYEKTGGNVIAVNEVDKAIVNRYGVLDIAEAKNNVYKAKSMVEKPKVEEAPSNLAVVGRYVLNPLIFNYMDTEVKEGKEIQLTDAISRCIEKIDLYGVKFSGKRYDCGNKLGLVEAIIEVALQTDDIKSDVLNIIKRHV